MPLLASRVIASCVAVAMLGCGKAAKSTDDSGADDSGRLSDSVPVQTSLVGDLALLIEMVGVGEDTCIGTIEVDVDTLEKPAFMGTAACEFEGSFASLGALDGNLQGDFIGAGDQVEGISVVSAPGQSDTELPWSGVFNGETLHSDVRDTVIGDRFNINYRIIFTAQ